MPLHKNIVASDNHIAYAFVYADAVARNNATGLTSLDVGKFSLQSDNNSIHLLVSVSPLLWKPISPDYITGVNIGFNAVKGSPGTIIPGQPVYISGESVVFEDYYEVELAKADSHSTMPSNGLAADVITDTTPGVVRIFGEVVFSGTVPGVRGDELFVSADVAGTLITNAPAGPNLVQMMAQNDGDETIAVNFLAAAERLSDTAAKDIGTSSPGTSSLYSRFDHVHSHGTQGGGDRHIVATEDTNGFMSSVDKTSFNAYLPSANEKLAMVGSYGTPGVSNEFVTKTDPRLYQQHTIVVEGGGAGLLEAAIASVTGANADSQWIISVYPGVYYENPIQMKSYVNIVGIGTWGDVSIRALDHSNDLIKGVTACNMANVALVGPSGSGFAALRYNDSSSFIPMLCDRIQFDGGYYCLKCDPETYGSIVLNNVSVASFYDIHHAIDVSNYGSVNCVNVQVAGFAPAGLDTGYHVEGPNAKLTMDLCTYNCQDGEDAMFADDGAYVRMNSCAFGAGKHAIHIGAIGNGTLIEANGTTITQGGFVKDLIVESSDCTVNFIGSATKSKFDLAPGVEIVATITDDTAGQAGLILYGEMYLGDANSQLPVGTYIKDTASTGIVSTAAVSLSGGLDVTVSGGLGFISTSPGVLEQVEWETQRLTLPATASAIWIVVNSDSTVTAQEYTADLQRQILLCDAATGLEEVEFLNDRSVGIYNRPANQHEYFRDVVGPINVSGGTVIKHASSSLQVDIDYSTFYIANNRKNSTGASPATFTTWYRTGSLWLYVTGALGVSDVYYDDGSGAPAVLPSGSWKRSAIYVSVNDGTTSYHGVFGQLAFNTKDEAIYDPNPPEILRNKACRLASLIVQSGSGDIAEIVDTRPKLGQMGSMVSAVTIHNQLGGLNSDDHKQYQLRTEKGFANGYCGLNASAKITSSFLDMSSTSPGTISVGAGNSGVSATVAHGDHNHGISVGSTATTVNALNDGGSATSVSRSDHKHSHGSHVDGLNHAVVISGGASGFMSGSDKSKLDGIDTGAKNTPLSNIVPFSVYSFSTGSIGGSLSASREDHVHQTISALAGELGVTDFSAASAGSANTFPRGDHKHTLSAGTPTILVVGGANISGSAETVAKSDHIHALPAFGSLTGTFCQGNDVRLSDDRTATGLRSATSVVSLSAATAPVAGQLLTAINSASASWQTIQYAYRQSSYSQISVDTTTASVTFVDLLSITITTTGGAVIISASGAASNTNVNRNEYFRILEDGTSRVGGSITLSAANSAECFSLRYKTSVLTAGSHTFKLQWRTSANTAQIRPVTAVDAESASLLVEEVGA